MLAGRPAEVSTALSVRAQTGTDGPPPPGGGRTAVLAVSISVRDSALAESLAAELLGAGGAELARASGLAGAEMRRLPWVETAPAPVTAPS